MYKVNVKERIKGLEEASKVSRTLLFMRNGRIDNMKKDKRLEIYNKYKERCAYCGKEIEYKDM